MGGTLTHVRKQLNRPRAHSRRHSSLASPGYDLVTVPIVSRLRLTAAHTSVSLIDSKHPLFVSVTCTNSNEQPVPFVGRELIDPTQSARTKSPVSRTGRRTSEHRPDPMTKTKRRQRNRRSDDVEMCDMSPDAGFFQRWRNHTLLRVELSWKTRLHYFLTGIATQVKVEFAWTYALFLLLEHAAFAPARYLNLDPNLFHGSVSTCCSLLFASSAAAAGRKRSWAYTFFESLLAIFIFRILCGIIEPSTFEDIFFVAHLIFVMAGVWYMNLGDIGCKRMLKEGNEKFGKDQSSVAPIQTCYNGLAMMALSLPWLYSISVGSERWHVTSIGLVVSVYFFVRGEMPFTQTPTPTGHECKRHASASSKRGENIMQMLDSDGTLMLPSEQPSNSFTPAVLNVKLCWKKNDTFVTSSNQTSYAHMQLLFVTLLNGFVDSFVIITLVNSARIVIAEQLLYGSIQSVARPLPRGATYKRLFLFGQMVLGLLHTISAYGNFKSLSKKSSASDSYILTTSKELRSHYASYFRGLCWVATLILTTKWSLNSILRDSNAVTCIAIRDIARLCWSARARGNMLHAKSQPTTGTSGHATAGNRSHITGPATAKTKRRQRNRRTDGEAEVTIGKESRFDMSPDLGIFQRWRNHTLLCVELSRNTRLHYVLTGCAIHLTAELLWLMAWHVTGKLTGNLGAEKLTDDLVSPAIFIMAGVLAGVWYMDLGDVASKRVLKEGKEKFWKDQNSAAPIQACYNGLAITIISTTSFFAIMIGLGRQHLVWIGLVVWSYFYAQGELPGTKTPMGNEIEECETTLLPNIDGTLVFPTGRAGNAFTPAVLNVMVFRPLRRGRQTSPVPASRKKKTYVASLDWTSYAQMQLSFVTLLNGFTEGLMIITLGNDKR